MDIETFRWWKDSLKVSVRTPVSHSPPSKILTMDTFLLRLGHIYRVPQYRVNGLHKEMLLHINILELRTPCYSCQHFLHDRGPLCHGNFGQNGSYIIHKLTRGNKSQVLTCRIAVAVELVHLSSCRNFHRLSTGLQNTVVAP